MNDGSAGYPKDGDPRACYAIVETEGQRAQITFKRLPYDIKAAAAAIRHSGLPDQFATEFEEGGLVVAS